MFKTFQSALLASFIGIVVLSLFVFAVLAIPRMKATTINQIGHELNRQIALEKENFVLIIEDNASTAEVQAKAKEVAQLSGSRVVVIDKNGAIIGDSSTPLAKLDKLENHGNRPEIIQAKEAGRGMAVRKSATLGKTLIYVAVPLRNQEQDIVGYLRFSVPSIYATELVMKMYKSMAVALAIAILVAATMSVLFARSFAKPIVRLSGISRRIAEGKFPQSINYRSKFEVGKLEDAIEKMSQKLADTFRKLSAEHERLEKLEKYRSEFVANVSHELKTPLTAIRNYVETLLNGAIYDKEHNLEFLRKIERRAVNLSYLIDDILEISQLESNLGPDLFEKIDLSQVIERVVEVLVDKAKAKGVTIDKRLTPNIVVLGNEEHIYRAIVNLLDNAVNYTSSGGRVEISCQNKPQGVEIVVADTGIGISKEHLDRIYERFYRVDKGRSRELGGTGLGLSIVKHVMNVHKGEVLVESEIGIGTKFTLIFPA
ncbi:MAG: ATP-binding protein [Candidatus Saganbacteria bacterium]|nr:ATP-binding protein [Candidatus Saganbacteria bacterium]